MGSQPPGPPPVIGPQYYTEFWLVDFQWSVTPLVTGYQ
jgi:hypothetical protein